MWSKLVTMKDNYPHRLIWLVGVPSRLCAVGVCVDYNCFGEAAQVWVTFKVSKGQYAVESINDEPWLRQPVWVTKMLHVNVPRHLWQGFHLSLSYMLHTAKFYTNVTLTSELHGARQSHPSSIVREVHSNTLAGCHVINCKLKGQ